MAELENAVIVSGARTAIGDFGGTLRDVPLTRLGRTVIAEAVRRAGIAPSEVEHVIMGQVGGNEPKDCYFARVAAVEACIPTDVPAFTVNRQCASGMQAIISAAQLIRLGECRIAVAGGAESMSNAPFTLPDMRWGRRMGTTQAVDTLMAGLEDPFGNGTMGLTAENIAARYGITRQDQDALAFESHRRGGAAAAEGRFADQIVALEVEVRHRKSTFAADEHVRADQSLEELGKLRPAFKRDGTVTAGNASALNDGGAAVIVMAAGEAKQRGLKPLASIAAWGVAGIDPAYMGLGPIKAVPVALRRAGITVDDLDVIENNEAFAAQALAVSQELGFPPAKTNPNGGAIALGHPIAGTAAILVVKALYELARIGGRYALVTMCIGGGQGIALVLDRG
jgi:acetyl-CoA C-acetyltransferase